MFVYVAARKKNNRKAWSRGSVWISVEIHLLSAKWNSWSSKLRSTIIYLHILTTFASYNFTLIVDKFNKFRSDVTFWIVTYIANISVSVPVCLCCSSCRFCWHRHGHRKMMRRRHANLVCMPDDQLAAEHWEGVHHRQQPQQLHLSAKKFLKVRTKMSKKTTQLWPKKMVIIEIRLWELLIRAKNTNLLWFLQLLPRNQHQHRHHRRNNHCWQFDHSVATTTCWNRWKDVDKTWKRPKRPHPTSQLLPPSKTKKSCKNQRQHQLQHQLTASAVN